MKKKVIEKNNFSVIIRTRNEERWIGHAIQSIIDHIPNNEIIIVDNSSTDKTLSIASYFQKDPNYNDVDANYTNLTVSNIENYTPGKSLNMGVKKASFDNIMIMSSHCVLKQIDLNQTLRLIEKYSGVFGNQIPIFEGKKIQKRYLWSHFTDKPTENMFSEMEKRYFFHNAISCFKRSFLIDNPFNEVLSGKEDRYWARDVIESGGSTFYEPNIIVDHHYTENGNTWKGIG